MVGRRRASRTSMKRSSSARPGSGASAVTTSGASTASSGCSMTSVLTASHTLGKVKSEVHILQFMCVVLGKLMRR